MLFFLSWCLKKPKKVIVTRKHFGLGDCLSATACAWRYAKATHTKVLVVLWLFSPYRPKRKENAFFHCFNFPSQLQGVSIPRLPRLDFFSLWLFYYPLTRLYQFSPANFLAWVGHKFFKRPFSNRTLERLEKRQAKERLLVKRLTPSRKRMVWLQACYSPDFIKGTEAFFKALTPKRPVEEKVAAFAEQHFANRVVIGAHVRYYHPSLEASNHSKYWHNEQQTHRTLITLLEKIRRALKQFPSQEKVVFLSCDSGRVYNFLKEQVPRLVTYSKPFSGSSEEYHHRYDARRVEATLCEFFLLARSTLLLRYPAASWFSHYASLKAKEVWY